MTFDTVSRQLTQIETNNNNNTRNNMKKLTHTKKNFEIDQYILHFLLHMLEWWRSNLEKCFDSRSILSSPPLSLSLFLSLLAAGSEHGFQRREIARLAAALDPLVWLT